jgi:DNA-binding NarL/FixJ family response regulator
LFKAVYSYKGKRVSSKNWSVKIQHLGERRTISLCAHDAAQAAKEASRLYQSVVKNGWQNFLQTRGEISADGQRDESTSLEAQKFDENYWAEKLIHRQHTIHLHLKAVNELSVRIDHGGAAHYFPLQTNNRKVAARRALRIFERVRNYGWEKAFAKFPRELTLAFRWSDSPLAWTYTTFYTETNPSEKSAAPRANRTKEKLIVAVAESDAGIRQALVLWINRMERFRCVASFSSVPETMARLKSGGIQFLLGSHNLVSESNLFSEQLKNAAPEIACLLYSTYEDSEELFRATPGGSGVYLLKRTPPLKFLEPIEASVKKGNFSPARIAPEIWSYFKQTVASLPVQNSDRALTRLTRREHEVLALLGKGFPDKEIADRLHISIWTVNGHMKNIFEKLDVHNRTEAVLRFLQK